MSISQPVLTPEQITEITNYVNAYRATNQAPPLVWDDTIYTASQGWSFNLVSKGIFVHSKNPLYGENLAYFQGYGTDAIYLIKKSIDNWYNEISLYNFDNPGFSDATGHFTCLVWVSSTKFAIGISINETTNAVDVVMNTFPPGNVIGEFQQNVLPSIGTTPIPTPTPGPVPTPTPIPTPIPTPMPVPIPIPIPIPNPMPSQPTSIVIHNIINKLNSIIYELQTKKRKNVIILAITNIIDTLSNYTNSNGNIVNELYNIIVMVQHKKSINSVISSIYHIIYELLQMQIYTPTNNTNTTNNNI